MATIGKINTIVSATTGPFTAGLGRAGGALKSFGSRMGSMIGGIGRFGGALVAAAGASGFGMMVKGSLDAIDNLAKTADAVGITTEALAGLRRAGELSGVASDKLDKSIMRMQRSISDASMGLSTAKKDFDLMGLSIEYVRSLSPEEQFLQVAEAIGKIPDQTDKTRVAMDTFGRDGARVLKILEKGAGATREEIAKAAELGLAPSREDAAKVEAANDAISDMKAAFTGIANTVAINVAPAITNIAGTIQKFGVRARAVFGGVIPILRQVGNFFTTVFSQAWQTVQVALDLIGVKGSTTFSSMMDSVSNFLISAEFAFKNVGPIAELMWEKMKLGALTFWEDTKHLFTTQLPEAVSWFADNFTDIFLTAVDFALTVFENLGKNIRSLWTAVLDFIAGKGFEVDWTPLTEGFKSTIKEMPEISEREMTDVEKAMASRVNALGGNLSTGLAEFTKMRRAELGLDDLAKDPVEIAPPDADALSNLIGESVTDGIKGAVEGPAALQRGSADAFSAILAAQRGESNPMEKVAKVAGKSLAVEQSQLATLKKLERSLDVDFVGAEL